VVSKFHSTDRYYDNTLVWVRFPSLSMVFYDESFLLYLASVVGKPIKMDTNMLHAYRGRFPRVCVQVDLSKPAMGRVNIWYHIEYESLHLLCVLYGHYGHQKKDCSKNVVVSVSLKKPYRCCSHEGGISYRYV